MNHYATELSILTDSRYEEKPIDHQAGHIWCNVFDVDNDEPDIKWKRINLLRNTGIATGRFLSRC